MRHERDYKFFCTLNIQCSHLNQNKQHFFSIKKGLFTFSSQVHLRFISSAITTNIQKVFKMLSWSFTMSNKNKFKRFDSLKRRLKLSEFMRAAFVILNKENFWLAQLQHDARISFTRMTEVKGRRTTQISSITAMNVNILPFSISFMPYSWFFWLMSMSMSLSATNIEFLHKIYYNIEQCKEASVYSLINILRQSNVSDACGLLTQQMNMWI